MGLHHKPSRASPVVVVDADSGSPTPLLDAALDALANEASVAASRSGARALILLDLGAFELDSPVLPDRLLVERLIDRLASFGWSEIAIASTADSSSTWAENREFVALAELFGYSYRTQAGTDYDVTDLSENLIEGVFSEGSVLSESPLSSSWRDAALRIVVAKACTDQRDYLALASNTLIAALPSRDKDLTYRLGMDTADALTALLDVAPPHWTIVDLQGVADGSGGRAAPERASTRALVASTDLLAADAAAAMKLGADPAESPLWKRLAALRGEPVLDLLHGDLQPLAGVRLPDRSVVDSTRARDRSPVFGRLVPAWIQRLDASLFPFKHPLDAKIHDQVAPRSANAEDPTQRATLLLLNSLCIAADYWLGAWRINWDKDKVERRSAGISPQTLDAGLADYERMEQELDALRPLFRELELERGREPAPNPSLEWRRLNRAIVFRCARDYPVPFERFVQHVDISRTIQLMNDYIGGTLLVCARDEQGRPARQVERNLYLPQPNYLAWWGGKDIDVSKIESVRYEALRQAMYWKTLTSENGSAERDDGIVTFESNGSEWTRVSILGVQLFTRPPAIAALRLDRYPGLDDALVEHAYRQFFSRTFANFEALLEGREIAIGVPFSRPATPTHSVPRPIEVVARAAARYAELAAPWLESLVSPTPSDALSPGERPERVLDADGFTHFRGLGSKPQAGRSDSAGVPSPAGGFSAGYLEAVLRDVGALWRSSSLSTSDSR